MKEYTVKVYNNRTEYRYNGLLHRVDGPAIEYDTGATEWWLNDKQYTEEKYSLLLKDKE